MEAIVLFVPTAVKPSPILRQQAARERSFTTAAKFAATTTFAAARAVSASARTSVCAVEEVTPRPVALSPPPNAPDSLRRAAQTHNSPERSGPPARTLSPPHLPALTPIRVGRFRALVAEHPDKTFIKYVLDGLDHGFAIGYTAQHHNLTCPNLPSAEQHHAFITTHLHTCCTNGETAGPFSSPPFKPFHSSGVGAVPKKSGKLRLIHHLSAPRGTSINDGISREDFSLKYISVDTAIAAILQKGQGAFPSKVDIRNAFRLCPVRQDDWHLLGIHWRGQYYFERVLPFGLRSSPFIFNQVADALEWVLCHEFAIKEIMHYLDDYLNVTGQSKEHAQRQLQIILELFEYLGVPVAPEKVEGPAQVIVFLGIILDTIKLEAHLPPDKLEELRQLITQFTDARWVPLRELESFLGKLSFAARVVIPGRTFMRRLWDLLAKFNHGEPHFRIRLPDGCKEDLRWWKVLLTDWNGKAFFLDRQWTTSSSLGLYTDASGSIGWGAYYASEHRWMYGAWTAEQSNLSITYKELYAVVIACSTWGPKWSCRRIQFCCDNEAVVACLASGTS